MCYLSDVFWHRRGKKATRNIILLNWEYTGRQNYGDISGILFFLKKKNYVMMFLET